MGMRNPVDVRTFAIVAHGGAGKTSLTEAMLFNTGAIGRLGKVEDGTTTTDFSTEEHKRQISINAAVATLRHKGKTLFALDAPGFADFIGDVRSSMRVSDSAIVVVSGVHGVEVQTEKDWEFAEDFQIPVLFFISKMDRENADFDRTVGDLRKYMSEKVVPLFLPIGKEAAFKGVVDILNGKGYLYKGDGSKEFTETGIPSEMADEVKAAREALVERIVEADDELMMRYLDGEQISGEELSGALRVAVAKRTLFPALPGSSTSNVGIFQLLDTLTDVMPSPLEMPRRSARWGADARAGRQSPGWGLVQLRSWLGRVGRSTGRLVQPPALVRPPALVQPPALVRPPALAQPATLA